MTKYTYEELADGIETIVPANGLKEKLAAAEKENRPLVIKFGMDPTAPDLHLGHAVALKKIKQFMENGHEIHLVIGDFTARIGDPSGRNTTRPPLTPKEVDENAKTYVDQLDKIFDTSKLTIHYNNEWMGKMSLADTLKLLSKATLAQMMQREDFVNRYENNIPIALHELIYPMMQGYDSVVLDSDIEFGGRDQLLNCLVGRSLQEQDGKSGQIVLSMPLLCGLDGHIKMSKSKGNYIGLTEPATEMYGKTMSIPDALIPEWVELVTNWDTKTKADVIADLKNGTVNPMEIKKKIAYNIVEQYHSREDADAAQEFFYKQVQQRGFDTKEFTAVKWEDLTNTAEITLLDLGIALQPEQSKSAMRRLIESGAVSVEGEKTINPAFKLEKSENGIKIKIGKRGFYNVV